MSFFTATAHLQHRTLLPQGATLEQGRQVFANHDILIRLDPELAHYEEIPPSSVVAAGDSASTKHYKITDKMETLPAHLWDTTVSFTASITNTENGVRWEVKAPLGLTQQSTWAIEPASVQDVGGEEAQGRLVLVEEVDIKCSRLLIGTVKAKCEESWRVVHGRWVKALQDLRA